MKKRISRREFIKSSAKAGLFLNFAGSTFLRGGTDETFDVLIKNGTLVDGIKDETRLTSGLSENISKKSETSKTPQEKQSSMQRAGSYRLDLSTSTRTRILKS